MKTALQILREHLPEPTNEAEKNDDVNILAAMHSYTSQLKDSGVNWNYCPECGCEEIVKENLLAEFYRECNKCGQEWYSNIDYSKVVHTNLRRLSSSTSTPILMEGEQGRKKCVLGCRNYTGGEIKHHKNCPYYPYSLSKKYDEIEAQQNSPSPLLEALQMIDEYIDTWGKDSNYQFIQKMILTAINNHKNK